MSRESGKLLACPFTWDLNNIFFKNYEYSEHGYDEEIVQHDFLTLIYLIFISYMETVKKNYDKANKNLEKLEEIWKKCDKEQLKEEKVSIEVVIHVMEATKYYVLKEMGNTSEAEKIIENIEDSDKFKSNIELGTLIGCESIVKSYFEVDENKDVISLAKCAISQSPDCPIWYLVLGKYLRKCRRRQFIKIVCDDEKNALLKSYELSKHPYFGIFLANMYRENEEYDKANEIYAEIYNMKPSNPMIQLKLALGFTRKKDFEKAKNCLDEAEKLVPNESTFLHYKGIYLQNQRKFKEAAEYFEKAARHYNIGADLQYADCMLILSKNFNYVEHLVKLLSKYRNHDFYKQQILLLMSLHLYYSKNDIFNASSCFLDLILMDPKNHLLKKFFYYVKRETMNIYDFVSNTLIPRCEQEFPCMSTEMQRILDKLKYLCNKYNSKSYDFKKESENQLEP